MKLSQQNYAAKLPFKAQSDSKKYLTHFESINTPAKIPPAFIASISTEKNKYHSAIELYGSSVSIIDKIADSPVKESQITYMQTQFEDFVKTPVLVNLNPKIRQRVISINQFFKPKPDLYDSNGGQDDGSLNGYIQSIMAIDLKNAIERPQIDQAPARKGSRSRSKQSSSIKNLQRKNLLNNISPEPKQMVHQAEVNTDPITPIQRLPGKLKKMDLLLVQIMKEKKRKGLVPDYFRAIEMKLVEVLEYILQDEPEYFGLSLREKMKEVLKNLESFKGKTIDGESKVNMLRIFFQQFRNLKKQREEDVDERENRSKSHSKKSISKAQSKKAEGHQNAQVYPPPKTKKSFDTQSVGGNRPQQKHPPKGNASTKSVKEEDQWIGSLDN